MSQNGWRKNQKASSPHPFSASKSESVDKAFAKACDILSRRDHSIKELQEKLGRRFTEEASQNAIEKAQEYGYIKSPEELSVALAEMLHLRGKGHRKICFELQKKGLPPVEIDLTREIEKASQHLDKLLNKSDDRSFAAKQKAMRSLANRGFDMDTIRQVTDEKF